MHDFLIKLGIKEINYGATTGSSKGWIKTTGKDLVSFSPIDGKPIATVRQATLAEYDQVAAKAAEAFKAWRMVPGPKRGLIVREIGDALRQYKKELGALVSLEMGKVRAEGEGEVQEMIDVADFAVGLSRQLYGLTMQSERPQHRMFEQWHPLGPIGIVSAFNFPVSVWSWNSLLAAVCGDPVIWTPSSKTPLTALAVPTILATVVAKYGIEGFFSWSSARASMWVSAHQTTSAHRHQRAGSTRMGVRIGEAVAHRLGRSLLELGGNNAIIIAEDADLALSLRAVLFGAVGTSGQRCTSTRRIIIHNSIKETFVSSLVAAYRQIKIGDPLEEGTVMGPLVDDGAVKDMLEAIEKVKAEGGKIRCGGEKITIAGLEGGSYVTPCIAEVRNDFKIVQEETFAPLLYVIGFDTIDEAIELQNGVPQGLSSAVFTLSMRTAEQFLSAKGSDCGIANVNIGTSGAEIGGAFGGEKETGGGRESGSDSWKIYMRRQTNTVNWGADLPLAQGIEFKLK